MKIAISGASGYIGQHLTLFFTEKGDEVVPLGRNLFKEENFDELCHRVESCDVVINLAGASINKRWTKAYKQELYDSRIRTTHQLVNAINTRDILPKLFISTSAVGYYPTSGEYDEYNNRQGEDFLARLCGAWEKEARACLPDVRLVIRGRTLGGWRGIETDASFATSLPDRCGDRRWPTEFSVDQRA